MLHPAMQRRVWLWGWQGLKPVQAEAAGPVLSARRDVVISAPTAAGKTEAAWLPILSRLLFDGVDGCARGFSVLAIAPLKALINDQGRRLEEMAAGTDIPVHLWHGDVAASKKASAAASPSGVLLTTPESLEAMMMLRGPWLKMAMQHLRYVVVDELHSFIGSERGKQLQSLLHRLEAAVGRKVPRVAMSATFGDAEGVKHFLRPGGGMPVDVVEAREGGQPVQLAIKEYLATDTCRPQELIAEDLYRRLRGSNNLVFTNSRKEAEAYSVALTDLSLQQGVPVEFRLHHGSLARADREGVERDLQQGRHPVTAICTASMELGIDIGKVKSVAQIGVAGSPSVLRQRLGRSGRRGEPAVLRIYSVDEERDDYKYHLRTSLVQNIAVTELVASRAYDAPAPEAAFLSTAVQQLLSMLAQYGSFRPDEAYSMLCGSGVFAALDPGRFASLLQYLESKEMVQTTRSGLVVIGRRGERLASSRDMYSAFTTPKDYVVVDSATRTTIGAVQYKPYYGEIFTLGGRQWIVDSVEERSATVYVGATHSAGKMMFEGTGPETPPEVTRKMLDIYRSEAIYPYLDASTGAPQQLEMARAWFRRHGVDSNPWISNGPTLTLVTWAGMRANRTIAMMAARELGINPGYDHLGVQSLTPDNVRALSAVIEREGDVEAYGARLASGVPRVKKERGKFDPYLPDGLLDLQYAATRLDVAGAAKALAVSRDSAE